MHVALRRLPLGEVNYGRRPFASYRFDHRVQGLGDMTDVGSLPLDMPAPPDLSTFDYSAPPDLTGIIAPVGSIQPTLPPVSGDLSLPPSLQAPAIVNLPGGGQGALNLNAIESAAVGLTSLVARPTPATSPSGAPGGGGTSVAKALSWFGQSSLISGIPNGVTILGGVMLLGVAGTLIARRR